MVLLHVRDHRPEGREGHPVVCGGDARRVFTLTDVLMRTGGDVLTEVGCRVRGGCGAASEGEREGACRREGRGCWDRGMVSPFG